MADWFRWWHGTVTDAKFGVISSKVCCSLSDVIAVWAYLLEQSSECHIRGDVTRYVSVTENVTRNDGVTEIAWALRMRNETVTEIVTELCNAGMILEGRIEAWERRQPNREDAVNTGSKTNAQRQKEYRERKKNAGSNSNASVTHRNASVTHQSRAETEQSRTDIKPLSQAASEFKPESRENPGSAAADPITERAIELTALLRKRGAALQASNPTVRAWAMRGISDVQALQALEIANERRAQKASPSPINAGYLDAILGDVVRKTDSPRRTIHDEREAVSMALTGRKPSHEQPIANADPRDITGESVRVA